MKQVAVFIIVGVMCLSGARLAFSGEKAPQKVVDLAHSVLTKLATDPVIIKAVQAENARGKTLEQIKSLDKKWRETPGVADYMQALMTSECGKHLHGMQARESYYAEIFVMDNQGANVCMTNKTSDYWQGDETKFTESYKGGTGGVHISDVEFDDSAQAYLVQVSVPVKDGNRVVGAMTFGIDVDRILN